MKRAVAIAALVVTAALASTASATSTLTKDQAFKRAKACLLKHGAFFVGRRSKP